MSAHKAAQGPPQQSGFTLIETLIVVVILGILAAVVTLGITTFRGDASTSCSATNAHLVTIATEAYKAKHPGGSPSVVELVDGGYLEATPGTC